MEMGTKPQSRWVYEDSDRREMKSASERASERSQTGLTLRLGENLDVSIPTFFHPIPRLSLRRFLGTWALGRPGHPAPSQTRRCWAQWARWTGLSQPPVTLE